MELCLKKDFTLEVSLTRGDILRVAPSDVTIKPSAEFTDDLSVEPNVDVFLVQDGTAHKMSENMEPKIALDVVRDLVEADQKTTYPEFACKF